MMIVIQPSMSLDNRVTTSQSIYQAVLSLRETNYGLSRVFSAIKGIVVGYSHVCGRNIAQI